MEDGVRIVENRRLTTDSVSWTFDSIPQVVIGVVEGPPEYLIGRLAGYHRLGDGSIVIGDGIAQTIRRYNTGGRFIEAYGGSGDGPGEYRVFTTLAGHPGDSVVAIDHEGNRATILDPQLNFVRSHRIRLQDGREESVSTSDGVADISADGHLLMYDYLNVCGSNRMGGFCEDSMTLFRTDMSGVPMARLGRFVYRRSESRLVRPGRAVSWGEPHPQVFRRSMGNRTYYADARRFEILIYDGDGELETIVRAPYTRYDYTRSDLWPRPGPSGNDTAMESMMRTLEEAQSSAAIPDSLPQFSDFQVDESGNMWVAEFRPAGRLATDWPRWYVFSPEGLLIHIVRTPPEFKRPAVPWLTAHPQIGDDFGLTERRDAYGVESVVMYRLTKG
jgi:hypothetical protein